MNIKRLLLSITMMVLFANDAVAGNFVIARNGHFYASSQSQAPYYFIGTNIWYAPILASKGSGGDRQRLKHELDELKRLGLTNLRILVGADAGSCNANPVRPYLQSEPGVLNDTLLDGLDYLLQEMEQRDLVGVFYLNNSWDWSGGYGFYLKQTGHGDSPSAEGDGYNQYVNYAAAFSADTVAQRLYMDYVAKIVNRTNRYTKQPYKESPAIMSWQICNEPRPFSPTVKDGFYQWITKTARLIKRLDPNHLVSTGSEGYYGCEKDMSLYERIHTIPEIDYFTIHIWPVNWGWSSRSALYTTLPNVYLKTEDYIARHERLAEKYGKPLVIEEFGYPRDRNYYKAGTPTVARDAFYNFVLNQVVESRKRNGNIAGANFWGWSGTARADSVTWHPGMDYLNDPPHEPQGWYSVFDTDTSSIKYIEEHIHQLK